MPGHVHVFVHVLVRFLENLVAACTYSLLEMTLE